MARLLYITTGLSGGLSTSLEIARQLTTHGHQISFLGHRPIADRVGHAGYEYRQLVADADANDVLRRAIGDMGRVRALPTALRLRRDLAASNEIAHAIAALAPDALIIDIEAHYAIIATEQLGIPRLLKSDWFSMARRRGIPPLNAPLGLPRSRRQRAHADAEWIKLLTLRLFDNSLRQLDPHQIARRFAPFRYDTVRRHDLRAAALARGLNLRSFTSQTQWLAPHVYPDLPMISVTARQLDFGPETNPNVISVGPMVNLDQRDGTAPEADLDRWRTFQAQNQQRGRALVYCTFGTMNPNAGDLMSRTIEAFRSLPSIDVVIGAGASAQGADHTRSENVLVLNYAPQLEVLGAADLAIVHGGINTIHECVATGVPMLALWSPFVDQPGGAARVEFHGLGKAVEAARTSSAQLAEQIDDLLRDGAIKLKVSAMQKSLAEAGTDRTLENVVDRLIAGEL